jgi:hypothetical protein
MKKILLPSLLFVLLTLSGCTTGYKYASFEPGNDGTMRYHSANTTLFSESPSPVHMANAYAIKKTADQRAELLKSRSLSSGEARDVGVIINDADCTLTLLHPESSERIKIPSGGFVFVNTTYTPEILHFRWSSKSDKKTPIIKKGVYNGVKYDWMYRIYQAS